MPSEPVTPTAPTAASESGEALAGMIRQGEWWQGSVIRADILRGLDGALPEGPTHWVIASQTCNLYSSNFEQIPKVEWIAARILKEGEGDPMMRGGRNPRCLEVQATCQGQPATSILCSCQERHWSSRTVLTRVTPTMALRDDLRGDPNEQHKDIFARWLARGYTRLELSNSLNDALKGGGFPKAITNVVKRHERAIFGFFLAIDALDGGENSGVSVADIAPPCGLDLAVVVRHDEHIAEVAKALGENFDAPTVAGEKGQKKKSRKECLAELGVQLEYRVVPAARWSVTDIEGTVRYNFPDYLSGSNEAGGE